MQSQTPGNCFVNNEDYVNHIFRAYKVKDIASMTSKSIYSNYLVERSQMSSTTQSKVNFVCNISTILEWKIFTDYRVLSPDIRMRAFQYETLRLIS